MMVRLPVSGLEVTLAQLGGAEDILLAEASSCNTRLAVALLARIGRMAEDTTIGWENLSVTDLDFLMLRLRRMVFGDRIAADTRCVAADCGERVEIAFQIEDYLNSYQPDRSTNFKSEDEWLQLDDLAISFRLPTGGDRMIAESHPDPERVLIERCVQPADISAELLDRVQAQMEAIAPSLGNILEGNCPECGEAVEVYFDPQLFCLQELRNRAKFIYEDIHLLAMYYRWTEESIMNLPRDRRRYYAEMIRQERRSI
jgi:hypothetical protein